MPVPVGPAGPVADAFFLPPPSPRRMPPAASPPPQPAVPHVPIRTRGESESPPEASALRSAPVASESPPSEASALRSALATLAAKHMQVVRENMILRGEAAPDEKLAARDGNAGLWLRSDGPELRASDGCHGSTLRVRRNVHD